MAPRLGATRIGGNPSGPQSGPHFIGIWRDYPSKCGIIECHKSPDFRGFYSVSGMFWEDGAGAGEGNRTLVVSLGSCCSTIELRPRFNDLIVIASDLLQCFLQREGRCLSYRAASIAFIYGSVAPDSSARLRVAVHAVISQSLAERRQLRAQTPAIHPTRLQSVHPITGWDRAGEWGQDRPRGSSRVSP